MFDLNDVLVTLGGHVEEGGGEGLPVIYLKSSI